MGQTMGQSGSQPLTLFSWFLIFHDSARPGIRIASHDLARVIESCRGIEDLVEVRVHLPGRTRDPYLDDGDAPPLALQLVFDSLEALERALREQGPLAWLAAPNALESLDGLVPTQQAMVTRRIEPLGSEPRVVGISQERSQCAYLVTYPGPAEDWNAWASHYIEAHGPLMARFPGIHEVEIHTPVHWCSGLPIARAEAMLRNRVVFDDAPALERALNSPIRHEMRADFARFPAYAGGNTHFAMHCITMGRQTAEPATVYAALARAAARHPLRAFLHVPASAMAASADAGSPGAGSPSAGPASEVSASAASTGATRSGFELPGQPFELSYADTLTEVDAVAARYRSAGYGAGHRVALLLENRPQFLLHFLALNALGASIVPINPDYRAGELRHVLTHSEAVLAVVLPERVQALRDLELPALQLCTPDDGLPAAPSRAELRVAGLDSECALLYTSGTTGEPKGCLIDNAYCLGMGRHYLAEGGLCTVHEGAERLITPLPLFHMNALCVSTMAMILSGGCVVQLDRFHPRQWWSDVMASGATIVHYLGVMPAILLQQPVSAEDRAHRVRFGFGANANPADHGAFEARFGFPLIEAWSMTETASGATLAASREPRHVGTRCVGAARGGLEVRLVDEQGVPVAEGEAGQLLVRQSGDQPRAGFFRGYLKDEAATALVWRDGWFHTGDVVRRGPDGQYHFVDRTKNIIRRSGENIAALEVEAALAGHPAVRQVAVIALADPLRGEEVLACVVPQPGAATDRASARSIQAWCQERLAYHKAPGWVAFTDRLPTTPTNKVQKAQLALFAETLSSGPQGHDLRAHKKRKHG